MNATVLHLVRTACLVESRAHHYSTYLTNVFAGRGWNATFEQWGREEETHGERLRAWLAKEDPQFDFRGLMDRYLAAVPYHAEGSASVYGSEQAELSARCFVEAMAATYYQALAAGAAEVPSLKALCRALAADEARHYTMFRKLLDEVRRGEGVHRLETLRVIGRRFFSLGDEQIIYASYLVGGAVGPFDLRVEGRKFKRRMASVYRPVHVRFVARLMAQVLELPLSRRS